jgi:hypothetical protein
LEGLRLMKQLLKSLEERANLKRKLLFLFASTHLSCLSAFSYFESRKQVPNQVPERLEHFESSTLSLLSITKELTID